VGLFDRLEQRVERAVNGAFAKAFRAEVQPVEIAAAMRRAMDDRAAVLGRGRTIVPNLYTVELSDTDYDRLTSYADALTDELVASAQEHAESQRYTPGGPLHVEFTADEELETGVFRLRPGTGKVGDRSRRPQAREADVYDERPGAAAGASALDAPPDHLQPAPAAPHGEDTMRHPAPSQPPAPPARRADQRPWLEIDRQRYPLLGAITVLGRDDGADIVLDDPGVSRRHCEVRITADGPHLVSTIRDLGSTNGTFVSGERIRTRHLQDGDRVTLGRTTLTFHLPGRK
jgi:hypothetical protein